MGMSWKMPSPPLTPAQQARHTELVEEMQAKKEVLKEKEAKRKEAKKKLDEEQEAYDKIAEDCYAERREFRALVQRIKDPHAL